MAKKKQELEFDAEKADRNKDGKLDGWEKAIGKKIAKSKSKQVKRKSTKKIVKESLDIANFVTAISEKNYAAATKYLTHIANEKLKARISNAINEPLF